MKKFVTVTALMLLMGCMSIFAQTNTRIYFESPSATDTTEMFTCKDNILSVTWYLSNGTVKTVDISVDKIQSGDVLDVIFPGTSAEADSVTSTRFSLYMAGESDLVQKTFTGFVDSVICKGVDDTAEWIFWH